MEFNLSYCRGTFANTVKKDAVQEYLPSILKENYESFTERG